MADSSEFDRPSKQPRLSGDVRPVRQEIPEMSPALRALMGVDAGRALLNGGSKCSSPARPESIPKVPPPRFSPNPASSSACPAVIPPHMSNERAKTEEEDEDALSKFRSAAQDSMSNLLNQLGVQIEGDAARAHRQAEIAAMEACGGMCGPGVNSVQVDVGAMSKSATAGAEAAARIFAKQAAMPKVIAPKAAPVETSIVVAGSIGSTGSAGSAGSACGEGNIAQQGQLAVTDEQMAAVLAAAGAAGFTDTSWQTAMAQPPKADSGPHVVNSGAELALLVQVAQIAEEMAQSCLSASTFCATASYGGADQAQVMAVANYASMAAQRATWALEAATNFELAPQLKTEDVENWVSTVQNMIKQATLLAEQCAQDCQERAEKTPTLSKGSLKDPRTRIPCKFFADGYCMNGSGCEFSHEKDDFKAKPLVLKYDDRVCSFYEQGKCARGNTCPWPHGLEELKKVREVKGVYKRKPGQMHMP